MSFSPSIDENTTEDVEESTAFIAEESDVDSGSGPIEEV
jgi:hypothetical protein